jgi:acetyl esterase/lipase
LPFTKSSSAILISADHTLLPSPNGLADITADAAAFWEWLHESLASVLAKRAPSHSVDLGRILVNGGSAGGYLAASLALSHPKEIRALAMAYPMLDLDSDWYRLGSKATGAPNPLNKADSEFPDEKGMRAKVAELAAGPVVAEAGPDRQGVMGGLVRLGLICELFDPKGGLEGERGVWPVRRVKAGEQLPKRVWVMHGEVDTAVPTDGSRVFCVEVSKALGTSVEVRLDLVPRKEHGFDISMTPDVDGMIKEATAWLAEEWLRE